MILAYSFFLKLFLRIIALALGYFSLDYTYLFLRLIFKIIFDFTNFFTLSLINDIRLFIDGAANHIFSIIKGAVLPALI